MAGKSTQAIARELGLVRAGPRWSGPTFEGWRLSERKRAAIGAYGDGWREVLALRHLVGRLHELSGDGAARAEWESANNEGD